MRMNNHNLNAMVGSECCGIDGEIAAKVSLKTQSDEHSASLQVPGGIEARRQPIVEVQMSRIRAFDSTAITG